MRRHAHSPSTLLAAFIALLASTGWSPAVCEGAAPAQSQYRLSIDSLPLDEALQELARQCGVQILFFAQLTEGLRAPALLGEFTLEAALNRLLEGSGLGFRAVNARTIQLQRAATERGAASARSVSSPQRATGPGSPIAEVRVVAKAEQLVATRVPTAVEDIPQSITVITAEQIRQQNAVELGDVMRHATGVVGIRGETLQEAHYARGFGVESFHVDGGAALYPSGNTPLRGIDPDLSEFDRVEVLRGSDALFSGNANPGATVSLVRKRPLATYHADVSATIGSWNSYRVESDLTGPLANDGALGGRADAVYARNDYFFDIAHFERKRIFGVLDWSGVPGGTFTVGGSYEWNDSLPFVGGWPVFLPGRSLPRDKSLTFDWSFDRHRLREAYVQYRQQFADGWSMKLNAASWRVTSEYAAATFTFPLDARTPDQALPPVAELTAQPTVFKQNTVDLTVTGAFEWWGMRQEVAFGGDYTTFSDREHLSNVLAGPPLFDPRDFDRRDYPDPRSGLSFQTHNANSFLKQYGVFGSLRVRFNDAWSATGGARVSSDSDSLRSQVAFAGFHFETSVDQGTRNAVTPFVGVMYLINPHYSWYASYADIYKATGGIERREGKQVSPEQGTTWQSGIKGVWRDGALNGSVAWYRVTQSGFPRDFVQSPDPVHPNCCYTSVETSGSSGAELEVSGEPRPGWLLVGGYTYTYSVLDTSFLFQNAFSPRHLLKVWSTVQLPGDFSRWNVSGGLTALSRIPLNNATLCAGSTFAGACPDLKTAQSAYAVLDLRTGFRLDDNWQIALSVNNVLDKSYYESFEPFHPSAWYGEPRNLTLRVDGKF